MSTLDIPGFESYLPDGGPAIQRLLFVADAAVADVDQLPPPVRAVIDAAAAVYVLTPTLPGRLAWLADEVDEVRHVADERLDTVLGHMDSIGVHAHPALAPVATSRSRGHRRPSRVEEFAGPCSSACVAASVAPKSLWGRVVTYQGA